MIIAAKRYLKSDQIKSCLANKGIDHEAKVDSNYFNSALTHDGSTNENVRVHELNP